MKTKIWEITRSRFKDWSTPFCFHWEMKGHWSRVNLVKCKALLKDLHATSVLSFPNANKTRGPKGHISCTWVQCATFLTDQPGWQFLLTHRPENTNLVEDVEILLSVNFHWIPFSGFREDVKNVSANQRPVRPSCFSHQPKKHKRGRGRWYLASCQVSLNSVQRFQRRCKKCVSQGHLFFSDPPEKHNLGRGCWDLTSSPVSLNSFQRLQRRSRKCLSQSEARAAILFSDRPEKHKLSRAGWDVASCQVSLNTVQPFQRRSLKCLSQSEARVAILFFRSAGETQIW